MALLKITRIYGFLQYSKKKKKKKVDGEGEQGSDSRKL